MIVSGQSYAFTDSQNPASSIKKPFIHHNDKAKPMTPDKVIFIAVLKAKSGKREKLRSELLKLIEPTRKESGNLDYVLFELREEPGTFHMREAFVNQKSLDIHLETSYFKHFASQVDELLEDPIRLIFMDQVSN